MKLDSCAFLATCAFSGTFQVDTTTGKVESTGLDFTFPGLPAFDNLNVSQLLVHTSDWQIGALNTNSNQMVLNFAPAPTGGTLVGFTGGSIVSGGSNVYFSFPRDAYQILGGSITPVPEPSSLVLFASGLLVLGLSRRFRKKVGPLSA